MRESENRFLLEKGKALIGFYCTVCGHKFDPRLGDYTSTEAHIVRFHIPDSYLAAMVVEGEGSRGGGE